MVEYSPQVASFYVKQMFFWVSILFLSNCIQLLNSSVEGVQWVEMLGFYLSTISATMTIIFSFSDLLESVVVYELLH